MDPFILPMLIAWAITRAAFNYKVDREYARQGTSSPRYDLKKARLAAAEQAAQAMAGRGRKAAAGVAPAEPARLGAKGYFRELWNDAWDDAHARRKRIRKQKKDGTYARPTARGRLAGFGQWLWEGNRPSDVVPADDTAGHNGSSGDARPADPFAPPPPQASDGPRYACPVCGDTLRQQGGRWVHPPESPCTSVVKPPEASGAARGVAQVPHANRRSAPRPAPPKAVDPLVAAAGQAASPQEGDPHSPSGECGHCGDPSATPVCAACQREIAARRERARELDAQERGPAPANQCPECGTPVVFGTHCPTHRDNANQVTPTDQERIRNELYGKCAHRTVREGFADEWCDNPFDGNGPYCREHTGSTNNPTSNGGTMTDTQTDLLTYNEAVAEHEAALQHLLSQRAEALLFKQNLTGSRANVESLDAGRDTLARALAPLAEGMEGSRFGADATQGSAEATGALTAGAISAVQEHLEAADATNDRWIAELDASIEGVQASLQHLKATYGEAAATVQETGVDARALAER